MAKYTVYEGKFPCHTCKVEVKTVRNYYIEKKLTWMCPEKHVSVVDLNTKKSRKDYE
jgi:hypothetical protein